MTALALFPKRRFRTNLRAKTSEAPRRLVRQAPPLALAVAALPEDMLCRIRIAHVRHVGPVHLLLAVVRARG
eukprot:11520025-Alexandrium_andersonii.AAC.1